jgi:hypothetical protein
MIGATDAPEMRTVRVPRWWIRELRDIVSSQADDDGLWYDCGADPAGGIQDALRELHRQIERGLPKEED